MGTLTTLNVPAQVEGGRGSSKGAEFSEPVFVIEPERYASGRKVLPWLPVGLLSRFLVEH